MADPMPPADEALLQVIDRLWEAIPPIWNQMRGHVRSIASEKFGISVQQFRVLRHIRRGARSASELAALTQTSPPAISQCVDALVEKGLLTRRQSTRDRRCVELELTPASAEMLNAIFEESRRWLAQRLAALSPEELSQILLSLGALRRALTDQVPPG